MRKKIILSVVVLLSIFAVSLNLYGNSIEDKDNALTWAYKACDQGKDVSPQVTANYAALANSLDPKWLRLSEAANALAGADALSKLKVSYAGASGNDAISVALRIYTMSAQFNAECGLTFELPETD